MTIRLRLALAGVVISAPLRLQSPLEPASPHGQEPVVGPVALAK